MYIARKVAKIIADHGLPKIVQSDQGREFVNEVMTNLLKTFGVDQRLATAYSPRTQGTAESHVAKSKRAIKRLAGNEIARWSEHASAAQLAVNVMVMRRKRSSPFSLYYHRPFAGFKDSESDLLTESQLEQLRNHFERVILPASRNIEKEYEKGVKTYHDCTKKILKDDSFTCADEVTVWDPREKRWEGIYVLGTNNEPGTYYVITKDGKEYPRNVGVDQLKLVEDVRVSEPPQERFVVERILSYNKEDRKYLVKWKGYSEQEATWEPSLLCPS